MEIKNIVLLVVFVLGLVYMQFIQAQSVGEIINKYAAARGGKEKLDAVSSLYMEGIRKMMGAEVAVKITRVQGKLFRNDFEYGGTAGYTIVTPSEGWSFIPMHSQKVEVIPEEILTPMKAEMDIAGPLINYAAKGHKAELAGKDNIDGNDAYKIKLTLNTGNEITYFLDTKTYLLIQTKEIRPGIGGSEADTELVTNFTDYDFIEGILFPRTIINPGNTPGSGSLAFTKIELNKPIDESQYNPSI